MSKICFLEKTIQILIINILKISFDNIGFTVPGTKLKLVGLFLFTQI